MTKKIFIWEGNGISSAYHDDGTLVVLADSPEEARETVRAERQEIERQSELRDKELTESSNKVGYSEGFYWRRADTEAFVTEMNRIDAKYPRAHEHGGWDGEDSALDREPDRIVELDKPSIIAFNGGGYD